MSFSTCSCVLWQKEQRNGSSGVNRFTGYVLFESEATAVTLNPF
jgi:hypothetical protein